ncbi:nitrile hydratase [Pseudonocardia thermophila]|jgi:nitrile hydratase, beta subunit|uniref:nitrile hydratase n=1 Tax=Pseudonocardia thermophila TaxID=1848 RepID=A0A1M6YHK1_PSETH|nr:nitrile hydratase subunit beta [Pseudonocardia thermophila]SHL17583.1 nitrile hydratase [Pseudonocardia thermophila]
MTTVDDLGGAEGFGPVRPPDPDEPVFTERWEGRAFALTLLTMGRISGRNLDAFRYALGRLDESAYFDPDGYYGRWLNAAELMLTDSAILAPGAVEARARKLRGEDVEEPPIPEPNKPDYAPTGPGSLRQIDEPPRFAVGDHVRTRTEMPADRPNRLPRYVRGHVGVVELIQPAHLLPDTHAVFEGENPQHVYTVRFDSHDLWGADAESFAVTIELYDSYLEPA